MIKLKSKSYYVNVVNDSVEGQYWYIESGFYKLYRLNGPAAISPDCYQYWYQYNKLHRDDGPALISPAGNEVHYLNGIRTYGSIY